MEAEEALLKQRLHDRETRRLIAAVEGTPPLDSDQAPPMERRDEEDNRLITATEEIAEEPEEYEEF